MLHSCNSCVHYENIFDTYLIYSVLFSGIAGYLYIDYLSNKSVDIYKIKLNKLNVFLMIIFTFCLVSTITFLIMNLFNAILSINYDKLNLFDHIKNDGTNSDNNQANSNNQNSTTNSNQQSNSNSQINIPYTTNYNS